MDIIIVGAGQFGSALGRHFREHGFTIHNVGRETPWPKTQKQKHLIFICVPTQNLPELIAQRASDFSTSACVISTCKGLLKNELETPSSFLKKSLGKAVPLAVLSGPSFADEIQRKLPCALVLAAQRPSLSSKLCRTLSLGNLRFYASHDPVGVEYCGALKNVYALLAGICEGLKLGENARASLNARSLAEMTRVLKKVGGNPMTVLGLAGAGDLFLTCSSIQSRNYRFGIGLAQGKKAETLINELGTVEGYWTTQAAYSLTRKKRIRAPLISTAYDILYRSLSFEAALGNLISRQVRGEFD